MLGNEEFENRVIQSLEKLSKDIATISKELSDLKSSNSNRFDNLKSFIFGVDMKMTDTTESLLEIVGFFGGKGGVALAKNGAKAIRVGGLTGNNMSATRVGSKK